MTAPQARPELVGAEMDADVGLGEDDAADISAQILARADAIESFGSWVRVFEFLAWSVMRDAALHILFGTSLVDIGAVFGPSVSRVHVDLPPEQVCTVVACLATESGLLAASTAAGCFP